MQRAGLIRDHLVDAHGYESRYVEATDLSRLLDEHERLHADATAKNLNHDHAGEGVTGVTALPASMRTPAHLALDAAVLRYRAEPSEENHAALLAEQGRFFDASVERITVCLIARSRGEHATGGCPECGDPATLVV